MNEELTVAIEELRQRPSGKSWFIPVRLDECDIPDRKIGGDEKLTDLQRVDLFPDWDSGVRRILQAMGEWEPHVLSAKPQPTERPVEEATWLKGALGAFDAESEFAKERWLFHLERAELTERMAVRIEGNTHYDTADRLERLGALVEIPDLVERSPTSRHRSFRFFEITNKGRILLEVLRAKRKSTLA